MENQIKETFTLELAKTIFKSKLDLLNYKASQWTQYRGYDIDKDDYITFYFKTSSYDIKFEVRVKNFANYQELGGLDYMDTYNYFKQIKYSHISRNN